VSVSWLIPVRDGGRWLGAAVESALSECGPADEVVVVDDGSVEEPPDACLRDPRVHLIRQEPLGITAALERGRSACKYPYIARLDADDIALPGRLSAQIKVLEAHPDVAVVGGAARMIRDDGPVPEGMRRYVAWVNGLTDLHSQLLVESPLFHPAVLMRASAVAGVGGYRSGALPEDYDLWLRLVSAGHRLMAVSQEVVQLRDRSDRLTRTDPRYSSASFVRVKQEWLMSGPLKESKCVALWGAGKTGRRWLRWLLAQGHTVPAVVDVHHRTERQGVPVYGASVLPDLDVDLLLVAVGARGARDIIRAEIQKFRPEWVEGVDWWALA
jgi:glycosyltransferase involved in cell wall biosynthesis